VATNVDCPHPDKVSTPRRSAARVTTIAVAREASGTRDCVRVMVVNAVRIRTCIYRGAFQNPLRLGRIGRFETSNPATPGAQLPTNGGVHFSRPRPPIFCNQDGGRRTRQAVEA
jgi:hypothetical protein